MKRMKKAISLVLIMLMVVSIFGACSKKEDIITGGKYTHWSLLQSTIGETLSSYGDMMMYKEMAKATGVDVEFIHPASGTAGSEAFQILMASDPDNYPDMIEYWWGGYAGGPDRAIADGIIISLNDYLKDYAPNYYDYMEGERGKKNGYLYKAQSMTLEGNYFGFRNMNIGDYRGFQGLYVRKDLIDKWGIDIPVTIDDWTNLFKVAKQNGIKYPFTGGKSFVNFTAANVFNGAWQVGKGFYIDGEKVKFGPFEKAYKEYIKTMADWLKAGYIDIDFVTNTSVEIEGAMTNGNSVAGFGYVGSALGKLLPAMAERNPEYNLVACPYPVIKKGDTPWFQELQAESNDNTLAITVKCGKDDETRYKEAIKWCDYLYSDEGLILSSFGIEGDTFTIEKDEDGKEHYIYSDKITNPEKIGAHSVDAAIFHFMRPANAPGLNQHEDYLMGMYSFAQQKEALNTWNLYVDEAKKHMLPPLFYTGEEAEEKANIEVACNDNLNAALYDIVLGKKSIDSFDDAVKKAKKDGYGELLKIQNKAYSRYLEGLKS